MSALSNTKVLAIIPARGGSKSIPRKNIRRLAGHPLIAYSIAAGLKAKSVSRLIVSTDDEEIAEVARYYGAEVPFLRPPELAEDLTPDLPVFQHALHWLDTREKFRPQLVVQLRPTSPLRPPDLIDRSVRNLLDCPEADCVRGVGEPQQTPYKMWRKEEGGFLRPLLADKAGETYNMPRQALPEVFWHTGHIDVMRYETLIQKNSMSGEHILSILVDSLFCTDIDTENDWAFTEWLIESGKVPILTPSLI